VAMVIIVILFVRCSILSLR